VQNDQQAATEPKPVTVRDIPTRKTLADGSHLLAETTAFLVSSSSRSRKAGRRSFCFERGLLRLLLGCIQCPVWQGP
jgi:hypothetical protein